MATSHVEGWTSEGHRARVEVTARTYEEASRKARLVGEHLWPELYFIDGATFHEGSFVGYYLGAPFDWNTLDPYLMEGEDRGTEL